MSDILFVSTSCLSTQLVLLHSIAVSLPDYCLYAIITVISALFLRSSPPPHAHRHPRPHVSSRLTLRFVALNIVSVEEKDRSTGNDMFLPGVKRYTRMLKHAHTHAHARALVHASAEASRTASTSQCNYRETEQSVTHLSAAGIRAGVLL